MGNTAGQLAHGFHFLGLVEFAFERFAFSHLLAGTKDVFDCAVVAALRFHSDGKPLHIAFFGFYGDLKILHLLADFSKLQAFIEFFAVSGINHLNQCIKIGMNHRISQANHSGQFCCEARHITFYAQPK